MDSFVAVCAFILIVQHLPTGECTTWSCDFETSDLCGYTQDTTDDLDWTRHSGGSPTPNTGPLVDHTLGTGHYMYLETSTGSPGEVARLVSAPLPASSTPYCLRFYFHMFGTSIGTLNVYIRKQGILGTPVWTLTGNQGNVWTFAHAQLDGRNSFNVIFEAVRGNSFRGDIALDDVTVSDECAPIATTVLPTTTPYHLSSPSCTFELSSICGYRQDIHDSAEWTWHQGQTGTSNTGPGFDHTLGTAQGHYMYFEASSIDPGVTARLLSPTLPIIPLSSSQTSYCLKFWYHMYGLHIGTLIVKRIESGGSEVSLWSLSDEQGNFWQQGQLPFDGTTEYAVVFEAVRGSSYRGDIAIDDVDVIQYSGQCEFIPASAMVPLPSTSSTMTTQSPITSAYFSTSGTLPEATTADQTSAAMDTARKNNSRAAVFSNANRNIIDNRHHRNWDIVNIRTSPSVCSPCNCTSHTTYYQIPQYKCLPLYVRDTSCSNDIRETVHSNASRNIIDNRYHHDWDIVNNHTYPSCYNCNCTSHTTHHDHAIVKCPPFNERDTARCNNRATVYINVDRNTIGHYHHRNWVIFDNWCHDWRETTTNNANVHSNANRSVIENRHHHNRVIVDDRQASDIINFKCDCAARCGDRWNNSKVG
ncbi:MALRD1 [Branchiostoma lanceolatum]|uniref:MALRD1 protein n=1 Tax=Branchiostoma lanceolatum TaxID=7740 RepID=A0A8J9YKR8_BRALA|nr:MALRD1 [Branchiostoma lanceolatum]